MQIHWVPVITSNLIHKNLLVISGTRCNWTFLPLMSIRSVLFLREKITRYSRVLVVTELVISGTQCIANFVLAVQIEFFQIEFCGIYRTILVIFEITEYYFRYFEK